MKPAVPAGEGGLSLGSSTAAGSEAAPDASCRLRLDLAYDGTDFSGWARQPGRRTVEQTVADALARVLRLPMAPQLTVAGRTDAGVHAAGQVAHVDLAADVDPAALGRRLAGVLPADVVVRRIVAVPAAFDARFAALGRRYRYRVTDAAPDPLRRRDTVSWPRPLDVAAMNAAAAGLVGEHDFAAYCRRREGASTMRTLRELTVGRDDAGVVVISAHADGFCHNQVRSMVGALLAVGEGRRPVDWPRAVLEGGVRDSAVTVAPPYGLTLVAVDYPPDDQLADRVATTRARR
ncbi:MAG TPA: tRNA pseudouridine(38-40) synthase TruA [Mycobacteriales bacterium]|nr:tRNA pseudouridine(38-40) synthase TruA [Mycobacteriales bacterium]